LQITIMISRGNIYSHTKYLWATESSSEWSI